MIELLNTVLVLGVFVGWFIAPILVNRKLAMKKGRNEYNWMVLGLVFQWLSTVVLLNLSSPAPSLDESIKASRKATKQDLRGM